MKRNLFCVFFALMIHSITFSQWVRTGGPSGAYTNEIVKSGSFLILNAGNGGIFKSDNNGASWEWSGWGLPCNEGVQALVENQGALYASISRSGVYMSTDNGASWEPINNGIQDKTFYSLFADGINIFAGDSNRGVYYSPDNGNTWINRSDTVSDMGFTGYLYFNSKFYAGGRSSNLVESRSLFVTSDNGVTWTPVIIPGIGPNGVQSMIVNDGLFYVGNDDTIFISSDGITWNPTSVNTNASIVSMGIMGNSVYFTTSSGKYYISPDNGVTWNLVQNTSTNATANHVLFSNDKIIMSTNQGLYESFDSGANWQLNNMGITGLQIKSFGKNSNYLFAGTDDQGVFRSADEGETWELINNGINTFNSLHVTSIINVNDDMYLGTGDGVYKTTNNGDSWNFIFNPGLNKSTHALGYDNGVFATGTNGTGIYISKDFGSTWTLTSTNGINIDVDYDSIEIVGNTIIVSTNNSEIFVSDDLGGSWKNRSIPGGFSTISDLQLINNKLYAGTSRGLFVSDNLGVNWSLFNNDIKSINGFAIDGDKVYAVTSTGVYVTTQNFGSWYALCEGLGRQYVNEIFISEGILFAGAFTSSVWRRFKLTGGLPPLEDESTVGIENLVLCPDSPAVNLFSKIGISSSTKGTWEPSLSSNNGVFNPALDTSGSYKFTFENDICGCESFVKINVSLDGLSAGNDGDLTLCLSGDSVDLFDSLGSNADAGGVWSPDLTSGTGVFDPKTDTGGKYTYTVINDGCPNDFSELNVSVSDNFDVGIGGEFTICSSDLPIDLFSVLGGTPNTGGEWNPQLSSGNSLFNPAIEKSGVYTYSFPNVNCSQNESQINITVTPKPNAGIGEEFVQVCINNEGVDLFDTLSADPDKGGTWSPTLASGTGFFDPKIDLSGIYTYSVENDCGNETSHVEVLVFDAFENTDYSISIKESLNNNKIIINVNSALQYEFSIDGTDFQESNVFYNLSGGLYNVIGREIAGCSYFEEQLSLISYPSFFSPNGDGVNDEWSVKGVSNQSYNLFIYDRYGKLLKTFNNPQCMGWNGVYNGYIMPATDYWFKLIFDDGTSKMGHFALKR